MVHGFVHGLVYGLCHGLVYGTWFMDPGVHHNVVLVFLCSVFFSLSGHLDFGQIPDTQGYLGLFSEPYTTT